MWHGGRLWKIHLHIFKLQFKTSPQTFYHVKDFSFFSNLKLSDKNQFVFFTSCMHFSLWQYYSIWMMYISTGSSTAGDMKWLAILNAWITCHKSVLPLQSGEWLNSLDQCCATFLHSRHTKYCRRVVAAHQPHFAYCGGGVGGREDGCVTFQFCLVDLVCPTIIKKIKTETEQKTR
jgi:hypothetical protein